MTQLLLKITLLTVVLGSINVYLKSSMSIKKKVQAFLQANLMQQLGLSKDTFDT